MGEKILIIDDEYEVIEALRRILMRKGYEISIAQCGMEACEEIEKTVFDLIISDMAMEDLSGIELLKIVRSVDSITPFIILTGVGTIESAVEAIQLGAFHFITKPFRNQDIEILAQRAIEYGKLNRKMKNIDLSCDSKDLPNKIIWKSKSMNELMKKVKKISDSIAPVLIMGETGVGKSYLAEEVHKRSSRRNKSFLAIDCGVLSETLLESELFGHVKGAFTGAIKAKRGLLEEAQQGTIFLDEICKIKPSTQIKLLSAIQNGIIRPVGSNKNIKIDVRFISASSKDLKKEILSGGFMNELYYRIAVIPLTIPPLRERREDIPLIIDHFLDKLCKKYKKKIDYISANILEIFKNASWKGNIRELANILERGVLLSENDVITLDCLYSKDEIKINDVINERKSKNFFSLEQVVKDAEKKAIISVLNDTDNNRSETARILNISRRTLYDKINAYNIGQKKN